MSATSPAEYAKGLCKLANRIKATGMMPEAQWRPVFRTSATTAEGLEAEARALGVEDGVAEVLPEEDGSSWLRLRGHVGVVPVEVTGEAGPVLLDPVTGEGLVERFSLAEVAR